MSDLFKHDFGVSVGDLRRYLRTQGWQEQTLNNRRTSLFLLPVEAAAPLELFVPIDGQVADAPRWVNAALETIADLKGETIRAAAKRIRSIGFDTLLATLPDSLVLWDSINLDVAEGFIRHARRLYAFSATSELDPRPVLNGISAEGDDYVSSCRFGHTFRGSFGFAIDSPVGPHEEYLLDEDRSPPPPARRYMQRIIRGLKVIREAGEAADPSVIERSYNTGFNANMCDEIVRLFDSTAAETVTFEVRFSPEWVLPGDLVANDTIHMNPRAIAVAKEAASKLRQTEPNPEETITGKVVTLATRENPADLEHTSGSRDIVIEWTGDSGPVRVQVRVDPATYQEAYRAHGEHRRVSVRGRLEQRRNKYTLKNARHFVVLD